MKPTLVVLCGLPLTGKTTLGEKLKTAIGAQLYIDINQVRWLCVGTPQFSVETDPYNSEELKEREHQEMFMSYRMLIAIAEINLEEGRSLIISATFSREKYREMVREMMARHKDARLSAIGCYVNDDDEIKRRITLRLQEKDRVYCGCNSFEHYAADRARYEPFIGFADLIVDTGKPIEECAQKAIAYVDKSD